jgi:HEPN domain-containing protein
MNPKFEECAEWLRKAKNDVLSARILLSHSSPVTDTACFHCQQAVEKSLKTFLVYKGISFEKVHSMSYLLDICEKQDSRFSEIRDKAEELAPYAVEVRYPGNLLEIPVAEAMESLKNMDIIIEFTKKLLPLDLVKILSD